MAAYVNCSECKREFLVSELIAYELPCTISIICKKCEAPLDALFDWVHLWDSWIWAVSDPDILEGLPYDTDINWQEGELEHGILCPYSKAEDHECFDADECFCDCYNYWCGICGRQFEVFEHEKLLFPVCHRCNPVGKAGEFRKPLHPSEIIKPGLYHRFFSI